MNKRLFFIFTLVLTNSHFAFSSSPAWTFIPLTATHLIFPSNLTSSVIYSVRNQSNKTHTLAIKPIQGITQVGTCHLEPKGYSGDYCTLNLSIDGSALPPNGLLGGPSLCQVNANGTPNLNQCYQPSEANTLNISIGEPISTSIDWRAQNKVTPVKNQGQCQASYAFSTTGVLESFYAINLGTLRSFSEQQILDCSHNQGCDGGTVPLSLDYVIAQQGLATEAAYPYVAVQRSCRPVSLFNIPVNGYIQTPTQNEIALARQVEQQPVSATIKVGMWFYNYTGGVINPNCANDTATQSVLIVGFTPDYWIIKNSYGTVWGDAGYMYLIRGINACGIANQAFAPV